MCLVTLQKEPRTTKKDLIVFKLVRPPYDVEAGEWESIFRTKVWTTNKMEKTRLDYERDYFAFAERFDIRVVHHFNSMKREVHMVTAVSVGFHAAFTASRLREACSSQGAHIKKFLIPAGSEVFTDGTGLIVSNQMMLIEQ